MKRNFGFLFGLTFSAMMVLTFAANLGLATTYDVKVFSNGTDWFKVMMFEIGGTDPVAAESVELVNTQLPIHSFNLDTDFFPNGGEISYSRVPFGPTSAQVNYEMTVVDMMRIATLKGSYGSLTIEIWLGTSLIVSYNNNLTGDWCFQSYLFNPSSYAGTEPGSTPSTNALEQNYPNPFNPNTTINYAVEQPGPIQIQIFDSLGRLVRTLQDQAATAGERSILWDGLSDQGEALASGNYYYQLILGEKTMAKKMLLLK